MQITKFKLANKRFRNRDTEFALHGNSRHGHLNVERNHMSIAKPHADSFNAMRSWLLYQEAQKTAAFASVWNLMMHRGKWPSRAIIIIRNVLFSLWKWFGN